MCDLVKIFNLESEVEAFVKARVRELAQDRHDICMEGHPSSCGNRGPHPPHAHDSYNTIRYGWLWSMCDGRPGETPEGELVIVWECRTSGSASTPAARKGYWFVRGGLTPLAPDAAVAPAGDGDGADRGAGEHDG
jgi:hypothetical protein